VDQLAERYHLAPEETPPQDTRTLPAQEKVFLLYRTGLYTFSQIFVLSVFNGGHPAEAYLYSGLRLGYT
jgi:hypothetical protein